MLYFGALNLARDSRQAEVRHQHLASAIDHDVGRLQIAMQNTFVVRRRESRA